MEIVFATKNEGKIREIEEILDKTKFEVMSLAGAGIDIDILEDGTTYEENALKKANEIMQICGKVVLADDSGLEIDYLNKEPGICSARYLGENTPYSIKNRLILERLKAVPSKDRTARFVSVIAAAIPGYGSVTCRGQIEGIIHDKPEGTKGFGYDPIFYVPEYGMTTAEMPMVLKNRISHRGKALRQMAVKLNGIFEGRTQDEDISFE